MRILRLSQAKGKSKVILLVWRPHQRNVLKYKHETLAAVTQLNRFPSTSRTNAQIFGEFVGSELSTMEEAQYKIVKKIIIDVLLKGNDNILQPDMQLYTV